MDDNKGLKRFNGEDDDSGKQLKKWRTWALAKMATMKDLQKAQRGPWLFTLLEGRAWDACEHFTLEQLASEDGEKNLWQVLSDRFPDKEATDLMGEALGEAFSLCAQEGESIKQWCARTRETFDRCRRRAGVEFPSQAQGWITLHCAGLSEEQKAIVKAKAQGKLDYETITQSMRSCFPTYKAASSKARRPIGALQVDEVSFEDPPSTTEAVDDFQDVETFLAEFQDDLGVDGDDPPFTERETAEALLASWKDRRQEINKQHLARKFDSKKSFQGQRSFRIEVEELKRRTKCNRCGRVGHWARECRQPPNRNRNQEASSSSGPATSAAGYVEHQEGDSTFTPSFVGAVEVLVSGSDDGETGLVSSPGFGVIDSGCGRTLIGENTLVRLEMMLQQKGLPAVNRFPSDNTFRFGNGAVEHSLMSAKIPVGLAGQFGYINAAIISGTAPLLLGRPTLEKLSVKLDFEKQCLQFLQFKSPMMTNQAGQLLVNIMDFPQRASPSSSAVTADPEVSNEVPVSRVAQKEIGCGKRKITLKPKECKCLLAQSQSWKPKMKSRSVVVELFSPPRFTKFAEEKGFVGKAYDIKQGYDLTDRSTQIEVDKEIDKLCPQLLVLCPPCTFWGGWDHLNRVYRSPLENARLNRSKRNQVKFCSVQAEKQIARGGEILFEHPWGSEVWDSSELETLVKRFGVQRTDMCSYGLRCPDTKLPIQKATGILTSSEAVSKVLSRCPGCSEHRQVAGKLADGRLVSEFVAEYTRTFVRTILEAIWHDPLDSNWDVNLIECPSECLVADDAPSEIPSLEPAIPEASDGIDETSQSVKRALLRLHNNLGHPSTQDLIRILKHSGASSDAIAQAKDLECTVCQNCRRPYAALPAKATHATVFNEKIGLDVKYLQGWKTNQRVPCVSIVDYATSFQVVAPIFESETAEILKGVLRDSWISWAGVPQHLEMDPSKPNLSTALAEFCENAGIHVHHTAADAHWQLGKVERHGQWFSRIFDKVCDEDPPTSGDSFVDRVIHTQQAKNQLITEAGASPHQLVFGRSPNIPQDLLQDNPNLSASEAIVTDDKWAKSQAIRSAARKAVLECQDDKALRAALRARSRVHREVTSGDWVYYWRSQKWQDGVLIKGGRWYGAAMVLGHIGRNVVVSHRRSIFRVAPGHVRLATSEEREVAEFPQAELLGVKTLLQQGQFPKSQFQDLVGQEPPPEPEASVRNLASPVVEPPAQTAADLFQASRQADRAELDHDSPQSAAVDRRSEDLRVAKPYGPIRYRRHEKSSPIESSPSVMRLPESTLEDFSEMMHEIVPQLIGDDLIADENPETTEGTPNEAPSSPRSLSHKRSASKEITSSQATSRARVDDSVEELLCQLDNPKSSHVSTIECLMASFIQKKMQKELPPSGNPSDLQERIDTAKITEWETLSGKNAVRVHTGLKARMFREKHPDRFIGSRFVITEKKEEEDVRIKARWCLQGHLDPDFAEKVATGSCHSPTLNQLSRALILQIIVSNRWTMCLGDIKGAFLEAGPINPKYSSLFAKQPQGGIPGIHPDDVIEVIGNVYGANDSPFNWWCAFDAEVQSGGWERSQFDTCLYYLRNEDGTLAGVLGAHVDDTITAGKGDRFDAAIAKLKKRFPYRKWRIGSGEFCGITYHQDPKTFEITYHQRDYAQHLRPILLSKERLKDKEAKATDKEISALRAINGAANWLSSQSRPDLCVQTSFSQQCFPEPRVKHLLYANQLVHRAKQHSDVEITIKYIPWEKLSLCFHSDAGFGNAKGNSSQAGYIAAFCSDALEQNQPSPWSPFTWKSLKLPRVVSSTLGAESQIFSLASSTVEWMSLMIAESRTGQFDLRSAVKHPNPFAQSGTTGVKMFGSIAGSTGVTDCKSLYDHLQSLSSAAKCDDKRIAIDLSIIKQAMSRTNLSVRWCPTELQLADGLTKDQQDPADLLRAALSIGEYQLNQEASILSLKKEHREQRQNRRKMLQEQEAAFRLKKDKSSLSVDNPAKSTVGFTEPAEESVKEQ